MNDMKSIAWFVLIFPLATVLAADPKSTLLVKVNDASIMKSDLLFEAYQQGVTEENLAHEQTRLINQLIERQLIRKFLASRKIEPLAEELNFQIETVEELIRKRGEDPKKLLAKLGFTPDRLRRELGLPLAWKVYVNQTITSEQVQDYFKQHKQELDGTQLRARQIFLKLPAPASETAIAEKKKVLSNLRDQIVAGKMSFADAAKEHSQAVESRMQGGDVGLFGWRGKVPLEVSRAAFALNTGEISEPIVSPFVVHLVMVTERHPGDYSLEDVRSDIYKDLSQKLWQSTVADEWKTAKIERPKQ